MIRSRDRRDLLGANAATSKRSIRQQTCAKPSRLPVSGPSSCCLCDKAELTTGILDNDKTSKCEEI